MNEAEIAAAAAAEAAAALALTEAAAAAEAAAAELAAKADPTSKSKPTDAEAKLLKEVMDKKTALTKANADLAQVTASLKAFEGLDPVAIRALVAEAAERTNKDLEAKGQWDALKKQLIDAHTAESGLTKAELTKALDSMGGLNTKIAELTVGVAFGQSKFISDETSYSVSKARKIFGDHFEYDGEKVVGYDKPTGAKDRVVLIDSKGDALSFDAALRKLVEADEDRDSILKSKAKPGAGSKTDPKAKTVVVNAEVTGRSRIAAGLKAQQASS